MKSNFNVFLIIFVLLMLIEQSLAETNPVKGGASANHELLTEVAKPHKESSNKITIVGAGNVGTAVAFSLLTQYVADEIVLIDRDENRVIGEVKDLQDGAGFIKSPKIYGGTDYTLSKNSKICIVAAGINQEPGQKREALAKNNLKIFKEIIPKIIEHNPNAILLIVTNPVDIMTYITWRLVGSKNTNRIIGSGTNLDSSRLRFLVSQDLNVSPESVHGWVIGEHGDSSVIAWSGVNVAGVNLRSIRHRAEPSSSNVKAGEKDDDWLVKTHSKVINSAYEIIKVKGKTSWAVALSVANLAYSILHNVPNIHAVSTMVKGFHGIEKEVFMSLPCVLGENGVTHIVNQLLEEDELEKLQKSAEKMLGIIGSLELN